LAAAAWLAAPASSSAATCIGENVQITAANIAQSERALLCRVNLYRMADGAGAVAMDTSLQNAARAHSEDMAARDFFDHTNPDGNGPGERAVAAGYPTIFVGENLASNCCTATAFELFEQWRTSTLGHNENMLDRDWINAGMGLAIKAGGMPTVYGTQLFGRDQTGASDTALDLFDSNDDGVPDSGPLPVPDTEITKAKKRTRDRTPTFRFDSSLAGASFSCRLDKKPAVSCTSPYTAKRLKFGKHMLTVTASDTGGIDDPTPAVFRFRVIRP
jgi:uncharacterized protein YkwD